MVWKKKKEKYTEDTKGDGKCFHYAGETFGLKSQVAQNFSVPYIFFPSLWFLKGVDYVRKRR